MALLVRLILAVLLVVGGSLASGPVSAQPDLHPCHAASPAHHGVSADTCRPRADDHDRCSSALGLCCPAMVAPTVTDVVLAREVGAVAWATAPTYDLAGRPTEPATPPPRI